MVIKLFTFFSAQVKIWRLEKLVLGSSTSKMPNVIINGLYFYYELEDKKYEEVA
jgi:hypothetical protein